MLRDNQPGPGPGPVSVPVPVPATETGPISGPTGYLHTYETLGTQDGPGLRLVVFLQGCPLRCRYCHNPDTWKMSEGTPVTVEEIVQKVRRMKPYFGEKGGVTISGGEPMAQADFLLAMLQALKKDGIHTALDTSGSVPFSSQSSINLGREILKAIDLLLLDIKHPDPIAFRKLTGKTIEPLIEFLKLAESIGTPVWLRHVVVPDFNDTLSDMANLSAMIRQFPKLNLIKMELLGYHTLGLQKYEQLGLNYPLKDSPAMDAIKLADLQAEFETFLSR